MERRQRRSEAHHEALFYQLEASRERAALEAMILADEDGLCVASAGDQNICDELAAHMSLVCERVAAFEGTVRVPDQDNRDVRMQRIWADGTELYLCAVGGNPAMRTFEIYRSATGVERILAS